MDAYLVRELTDVGLPMIDDGAAKSMVDDESRVLCLHEAVAGPAPLSTELARPVTNEPRRVH